MNPDIFRSMSYGVYIVSTMDGNRPTGCVANSIMQITSSPATVALSMNHDNYTHSCIQKTGTFAFSILSEQSSPRLIGTFGFSSGRDTDKFSQADVDYEMIQGLPIVKDGCGYVICRVTGQMETSTHTVFLAEVLDGDVFSDAPAMTYKYYHTVIKGKSPKNAPTYLPEETPSPQPALHRYVCDVCGYVFEGESLPPDFHCPVCGVDASHFKLLES